MLLGLIPLLAYAQPDSSQVIIRFNGGYTDLGLHNGVFSLGAVTAKNTEWNLGLSVGLTFGKNYEAGVGFEYIKQKIDAFSEVSIPIQNLELTYTIQGTLTDLNFFIGKVYLSKNWRIINKLYFSTIFSASVGKATGTQEVYTFKGIFKYQSEKSNDPKDFFQKREEEANIFYRRNYTLSHDYFGINLSPAFSYYFTRHFALNLETGIFGLNIIDWDWENKQCLASINPAFWQFGIIVAF